MQNKSRAFTLIELLVAVLIIGILAAVALPQYNLAVAKSRYATIKNLTNSIAQAEEVYYLANGEYANDFEKLDVDMPSGKLETSTSSEYKYDWGSCWVIKGSSVSAVTCEQGTINIAYRKRLNNSAHSASTTACMIFKTRDLADWRNKICKSETGGTGVVNQENNQISWNY